MSSTGICLNCCFVCLEVLRDLKQGDVVYISSRNFTASESIGSWSGTGGGIGNSAEVLELACQSEASFRHNCPHRKARLSPT